MTIDLGVPRPVQRDEMAEAHAIINAAAQRYRGTIPDDCWREPYMPRSELKAELDAGVAFWGLDVDGALAGVMGLQSVRDVQLIRHAYVRPDVQGRGIGGRLLRRLVDRSTKPLLVGTWAAAEWAVAFYCRNAFTLAGPEDTQRLLSTYWHVSRRQAEVSVVLRRNA